MGYQQSDCQIFSTFLLAVKWMVLVAVALWSSQANAQLIEGDALLIDTTIIGIGTPGFDDYEHALAKTTQPRFADGGGGGRFSFGIEALEADGFQFNGFGIAEGYALFFAMPGDEIAPDFVNSNVPFATNYIDPPFFNPPTDFEILTLAVGESVLFGYWDDQSILVDNTNSGALDPGVGDNFGWLELGRSARLDESFGKLEILGSATAIGRGIVVGTTNTIAIPEPSTIVLVGLLGAIGSLRRRRS